MKKSAFFIFYIFLLLSGKVFGQNFKLKITGNSPEETLSIDSLNYLKTHKDYISIKAEIDSIQNQLSKKGYIENQLTELKQIKDDTYSATFTLKKKFKLIHIYYNDSLISKSIINLVTKNITEHYFILNFQEIENTLSFLNSKLTEKGNPFSKLKLSEIKLKNSNTLSAKLLISPNEKKRTISKIIIKGYEKFPKSYLKHYLKIKTAQVFDLNKIKNKTENLNNLRFASQTKPPEVLFSKDSSTIYLYLKKEQNNSFDGFLGFGTNEETNKIEFDGYLDFSLINNLDFGESFKLLYKSDKNNQKTFRSNLTLPYIFKTPIGINLSLNIFKKDSSFTTVNQFAKLHYQINSKNKVYSGILYEESNNLLNENNPTSILDYKKNFLSLSYEFTKPIINNRLFPIKSYLYVETNFGNRKSEEQNQKQSLLNIHAYNIFNLNNKNSLYFEINGATINSDSYFENELLRFGGINSIRGFEENSLYATLFGVINSEYRFKLNNSIYLHTVIDAAYYENKILSLSKKLFGYGFGFGINTKSGLFKLNYANGKSEDQQFKLSNSKVHISLTTIF
ncbi:hypothetical protein N1F78_03480 [Seonamhaeicola sp. MEBiC1930]|uniref:POTRA domain-containing protein n=1 Tax=Seonamhaeicola sp. MEBiC01930 TaxID=2976768 RepID=UPI00324F0882